MESAIEACCSIQSRYHGYFATGGVMFLALLSLPIMRTTLEATLINHMLIQIPLLVLSGWLIGKSLPSNQIVKAWNADGIPCVLIAVFSILFWMIPRWLDAAVSDIYWEAIKFITIPLCVGVPLGYSWSYLSPFSRAVIWTNVISMLFILGWLYISAPLRICNNYLVNQQEEFGYAVIYTALLIVFFWTWLIFFGTDKNKGHGKHI